MQKSHMVSVACSRFAAFRVWYGLLCICEKICACEHVSGFFAIIMKFIINRTCSSARRTVTVEQIVPQLHALQLLTVCTLIITHWKVMVVASFRHCLEQVSFCIQSRLTSARMSLKPTFTQTLFGIIEFGHVVVATCQFAVEISDSLSARQPSGNAARLIRWQ